MLRKIFNRSSNIKELNYKAVKKILKQENGVLIDVRSNQEYEEWHLPGAICISLYDITTVIQQIIPDKKAAIIVYCSSGIRSKQAQEKLEQLGYKNVYNLKDGIDSL